MYKIIRVVKFLKPSWTFLVIVSTVAVLCAGCKLDYKDADLAEEMNAQVPNSVLEDFSQVVVRDGKVSYIFSADHAELYDSTKLTYFDNIGFTEYKADGSTGTEGAAQRAVHDSKTDNIIFDGKIILNSTVQDFVVKSDYLEWNNEAKILKSLDDTEGTMYFNSADLKRMPSNFGNVLTDHSIKSKVSSEPDNSIDGGFILKNGDVEENMSFSAVIAANREKLEDVIGSELFVG